MENKNGLQKFNSYITNPSVSDYLKNVLGERKEAFVTNCVSLVSNNASLQGCVPSTVMYAAIKATSLGLTLDNNLGFAYVLPYNNTKKGVQEAQFQMGYKGFIQLAQRSGQFQTINSEEVKEGEIIKRNRLTGEIEFNWIEDDVERNTKKTIGFVAYFKLTNGFEKSLYMTVDKLQQHGQKYSKSYNSQYSNWKQMFETMAEKTVIKLLLSKYAPLSIKMQEAVQFDQAVIKSDNEFEYVDNDTTVDVEAESEAEETSRVLGFIEKAETTKELKKVKSSLSAELQLKFEKELENRENELILIEETA